MVTQNRIPRNPKFNEIVNRFESNTRGNDKEDDGSCLSSVNNENVSRKTAGVPRSSTSQKGRVSNSSTAKNGASSATSPVTKSKKKKKQGKKSTIVSSSTYDSCPSLALSSESDGSSAASSPEKRQPRKSILANARNLSEIPESDTLDESKNILEMSLVLDFSEQFVFSSPRKSSQIGGGSQTSWDEETSKSSLSRMSPKIRSLPRDLDFHSSGSSCTLDDEDSELLARCMKQARNKASRFW